MKVKVYVSMNLVGCERKDTIEFPDDASEDEIEEEVREWMFEQIEWGWEKPE